MQKRVIESLLCLLAAIGCAVMPCALAQGLAGAGLPNPRGGTSAGGPLIPGKNDEERWKFLQSNMRQLIGKTKPQIVKLFGKEGGPGLEKRMLVYQITQGRPRKPGGLACIDLSIKFDEHGKVHYFAIVEVKWL